MDSRAHSYPCQQLPPSFQLTARYWHKNQPSEHVPTIDLGRSIPISSTIRVACSLCNILYLRIIAVLQDFEKVLEWLRCSKFVMQQGNQFWIKGHIENVKSNILSKSFIRLTFLPSSFQELAWVKFRRNSLTRIYISHGGTLSFTSAQTKICESKIALPLVRPIE